MAYKPFALPYTIIGGETIDPDFPKRVKSDFESIESKINEVLKYENKTGLPVNTRLTESGYYSVEDDGLRVYDSNKILRAHLGYFEALGTQTAVFTRNSVAYKTDGTQVVANLPRYETGRFGQAVMVEEGTTNLLKNAGLNVGAGTVADGWTSATSVEVTATYSLDGAIKRASGAKSQKIAISASTGSGVAWIYQEQNVIAGTTYTASVYNQGTVTGTCRGWVLLRFLDGNNGVLVNYNQYFTPGANINTDIITITGVAPTGTVKARIGLILQAQVAGDTGTIYYDDVQLEAKGYMTSVVFTDDTATQAIRSAENFAIPTAGNFTKGNWAVELTYIPKINDTAYKKSVLWSCYIDANNYYELRKDQTTGYLTLTVVSGGVAKTITGTTALAVDSQYSIMASGDGSYMRLAVNGTPIGSDTAYIEPVGTLPTNMYIGSDSAGANQCNGLIDDLRIGQARTLQDHIDAYNRNLPLIVDDKTIYKMNFDNTLQPNTRTGYGFMVTHNDGSYSVYSANGPERYVAGTAKKYHYLMEVGTGSSVVQNPNTSPPLDVTITLPNEFKGKDFKVSVSLVSWVKEEGYLQHVICQWISSDIANGTFVVRAYVVSQDSYTVSHYGPVTFAYTVIA